MEKKKMSLSQSKINRLDNGNIEITITIPKQIVSESYKKTLKSFAKSAKIRGFRPGNAPDNLVEQSVGKEKIYQKMAKTLLTQAYIEAIKTHKIMPVVNPQFSLTESKEGQDWTVKAITAELPEIELGNYKEEVKKALAGEKIWVPGKNKSPDGESEASQDKRLQKIFETIFKIVKIKLPEILVEGEINRMLSRLVDQTARLGLTVEQYLTSQGKTAEQIRLEYRKQAEESLTLELVLAQIANKEEVKVTDEEIDKMIQAVGDEKAKKNLETPSQKAYIRQTLRKRKVIDNLLKL